MEKVIEYKATGWVAWAAAVYVITSLLFLPALLLAVLLGALIK